jgi:general secretion pathway protein F
MGWKDLLNFDIARLWGVPATASGPRARVYWWTALWRYARYPTESIFAAPGSILFTRRQISRAARPNWKGPVYLNARTWRRDVVLVIEQIRGLIACNVPLAPGLAAAAREEQRIRGGWSPQRASALLRNAGVLAILLFLGMGIALERDGLGSSQGVAMAVMMILFAGWYIWSVVINHNSRTGVFLALERRIAAGAALSEAMGSLPRFFPRHLADLVEAGETAGNLAQAFDQFSESMLNTLGLNRQIKRTLLYIKTVLLIQFALLAFLSIKVLPVWVEVLQEMNPGTQPGYGQYALQTMPLVALVVPDLHTVITISDNLANWGGPLLALIAGIAGWRFLARFRRRRSWASRGASSALLLLPWFRGLVVRHNLGLIATMLHGLLRAGVPLDRALAMAMGSDLLPAYRNWVAAFRERIQQGDSMAEALARVHRRGLIPDSFRGLLEAGERAGQVPEMFERIAELYRRESERRLHLLAALILPAGVFLMGYITLCVQTMVFGSMAAMIESLLI